MNRVFITPQMQLIWWPLGQWHFPHIYRWEDAFDNNFADIFRVSYLCGPVELRCWRFPHR
jgi:hypothetical protein